MPAPKQTSSTPKKPSTQDTVLIAEIRDDVVVMRDGSLRSVLMASAVNFDLMSGQEREGVEYSYQGFLNSLHFSIQILIKSQRIDLDGYLENLAQLRQSEENPLLAGLMDDYIGNIQNLVEQVNIMDKQFFVIIPFEPAVMAKLKKKNIVTGLAGAFKKQTITTLGEADFKSFKEELSQRVGLVSGGLGQMGVRNIPLNTQELIDLFYLSYNPDVAQNQKLVEAGQLQTAAVTKGEGDAPQHLAQGGPF